MAYWVNKDVRTFMSRGYLPEGQTVEERFKFMAQKAEEYLGVVPGFAKEFEEQIDAGFFSFSSPEWANFGLERGLPISCNGVYIDDTMDDILYKAYEVGMQTKMGAGTSFYFW